METAVHPALNILISNPLTFQTLRDVQLSFEVQVKGFDNGDDMKYQLWFDGISQEEVVFIEGQNDFSTDSWI